MAILVKISHDGDTVWATGESEHSSKIIRIFDDEAYEEAIHWFKKFIAKDDYSDFIGFRSEELPVGKSGFPRLFPTVYSSSGYSNISVYPSNDKDFEEV